MPPDLGAPDGERQPHEMTVLLAWKALDRVTFLPASPDKRFYRQMSGRTDLTSRQFDYLRRLVHRYRRQLGEDHAMRLGAGLKSVQDAGFYDEP